MRHLILALIILIATAGAASAQKLAGYTVMTYDSGHGTQVEYLDTSGGAFLWYPLNSGIVSGSWKTEGNEICFRYGRNTYNPVTRKAGGGWDCMPLDLYASGIADRKRGDVFNLASGNLPYQLQRERTTIAKLEKGLGVVDEMRRADAVPPQEQCDAIIANQNKSKAAMVEAATLYYHGMRMGERCVAVDYIKAFELLRAAGETRVYNSLLRNLREKAATGNPKAVAALKKLEP